MFEIVETVEGILIIVTDNPSIAALIDAEVGEDVPTVFFTGAPTADIANDLARRLHNVTGRVIRVEGRINPSMGFPPWTVVMEPAAEAPNCPKCSTKSVIGTLSGYHTWFCKKCDDYPSFGSKSESDTKADTDPDACPVTLVDILQARFLPMDESDYDGFAGVQGNGYIAKIKGCLIIYDDGADNDECGLQVHDPESSHSWGFKVSSEAVRL